MPHLSNCLHDQTNVSWSIPIILHLLENKNIFDLTLSFQAFTFLVRYMTGHKNVSPNTLHVNTKMSMPPRPPGVGRGARESWKLVSTVLRKPKHKKKLRGNHFKSIDWIWQKKLLSKKTGYPEKSFFDSIVAEEGLRRIKSLRTSWLCLKSFCSASRT